MTLDLQFEQLFINETETTDYFEPQALLRGLQLLSQGSIILVVLYVLGIIRASHFPER